MINHYTHEQIASNYALWREHGVSLAELTEEEFHAITLEDKVNLIIKVHGTDQNALLEAQGEEDHQIE